MQNFSYRLVGLNCLDALTGTQKLRNNQDARCRTLLGQFGRSDSHANARRMFISRRLWRLASVLSKHVDSRQTGRHEGRWRRLLIFDFCHLVLIYRALQAWAHGLCLTDLGSVCRCPSVVFMVMRGASALIWVKRFGHVASGLFGSTKSGKYSHHSSNSLTRDIIVN